MSEGRETTPCGHERAVANKQGIYTCPDCWQRVPADDQACTICGQTFPRMEAREINDPTTRRSLGPLCGPCFTRRTT